MAVGSLYNVEMLIDAWVTDLRGISIVNGYKTDFSKVEMPSWSFEDDSRITAQEDATLLVWLDEDRGGQERSNSSEDRPELSMAIVGIFKRERDLQMAMLRAVHDIRRVARSNPQRNHPENAALVNTWGVDTELDAFSLAVHRTAQASTIGVFSGTVRLRYRCPRTTG